MIIFVDDQLDEYSYIFDHISKDSKEQLHQYSSYGKLIKDLENKKLQIQDKNIWLILDVRVPERSGVLKYKNEETPTLDNYVGFDFISLFDDKISKNVQPASVEKFLLTQLPITKEFIGSAIDLGIVKNNIINKNSITQIKEFGEKLRGFLEEVGS